MEVDLCLPSFCTMRKRSRSRSPTPCEHDRPLVCTFVFWSLFCSNVSAPIQKRSSALALAVGDCAREPPPSFTPPQSTSPSSPAQAQALSAAFLLVPAAAQLAYIPAVDAEGGIQDEWVALTRNLTLLSAHGAPEHESAMCGNREEIMMVRISNMNSCS